MIQGAGQTVTLREAAKAGWDRTPEGQAQKGGRAVGSGQEL